MREDGPTQDLVKAYLNDIGKHSLLTKDDEVQLARAIEDGKEALASLDQLAPEGSGASSGELVASRRRLRKAVREGEEAKQHFIESNLRLVVSIAKKYQSSGLPLLDLIQEGNLGLIHAVEKFEWRKGFKFSTYATWWIRQAITRGIANTNDVIRLPVHAREVMTSVRKLRDEMETSLSRSVTMREAAESLDITGDALRDLMSRPEVVISLSAPMGENGDMEFGDTVSDGKESDIYNGAFRNFLLDEITKLFDLLTEREAELLRFRFCSPDGIVKTHQEAGEKFDLSRERVRQVEFVAMSKLRHPSHGLRSRDWLLS